MKSENERLNTTIRVIAEILEKNKQDENTTQASEDIKKLMEKRNIKRDEQ